MYESENYSNRMLEEINLKRELMIKSAEVTGYTSEKTIYYSQELDKLIYEYQCSFRSESKGSKELKNSFQQMLIWTKSSLTSNFIYI